MELNKYIEHTLLKQDATKQEIVRLLDEAIENKFLGVCVNPVNVSFAYNYLKGKDIKIVTVIGFPLGQSTSESKVLETIDAIKNGADEIDMVLNSGKLKDGEFEFIIEEISKIKKASRLGSFSASTSTVAALSCSSRVMARAISAASVISCAEMG